MRINFFELLFEAFEYGADYGQLAMEQERDMEDFMQGGLGWAYSRKMSMPLAGNSVSSRRKPHSEAWRAAKSGGLQKLNALIRKANETACEPNCRGCLYNKYEINEAQDGVECK